MKNRILILTYFLVCGIYIMAQNTTDLIKSQEYYQSIAKLNIDTDEDGVNDFWDKCIETPLGARIDGAGCALDIDMDGIIDLYDRCITEPGVASMQGCPEITQVEDDDTFRGATFEFKKDFFDSKSFKYINNSIKLILKFGKGMTFLVEGHSNEYKSERNNLKLSLERAQKVKEYMVQKGVDEKQLVVRGVGSSDILYPECKDIEFCVKKGEDWKNTANRRVVFKVLSTDTSQK